MVDTPTHSGPPPVANPKDAVEQLAPNYQTIAFVARWFGSLLAFSASGFLVVRLVTTGADAQAGWAAFSALYGACIWYANRGPHLQA